MKKIYVIQMNTKTIPSRFVSLFTMYKYGHVALSLDKECNITYSFGRRNLYSILNGGFVIESKTGKFFSRFKDTECRVFEVKVSDNQYNNLVKVIEDMKVNQNIYKYDYLGIILRFLKIPVSFKNKYVCSYFIAKLLEDNNICVFDKKVCFVKPRDFALIDGFDLVYTGKYLSYQVH